MNSRIRQLVRQDLKQIINDLLDYELPTITGKTHLQNDLGMDSLDVVELIKDFRNVKAEDKEIDLTLKGFKEQYNLENTEFKHVKIKDSKEYTK